MAKDNATISDSVARQIIDSSAADSNEAESGKANYYAIASRNEIKVRECFLGARG